MKNIRYIPILLMLIIIFTLNCNCTEPFFEYIGGPDCGETTKLVISKTNTLYLGSRNGLFKSTNSGKNWIQIFSYGTVQYFSVFNDNIIALSSGYMGRGDLYITKDGGTTWENKQNKVNCKSSPPFNIVFDDDGFLYCQCYSDDIKDQLFFYKSSNFGSSFNPKVFFFDSMKPFETVSVIEPQSLNGKVNIIINFDEKYYKPKASFYSYLDSNLIINNIFEFPGNFYVCESFNDSTFIIGTENGIFRSTNNGVSWETTEIVGSITSITKLSENEILALGRNSIYYTKDKGRTWNIIYDIINNKFERYYFYKIYHGNGDTVFATGLGFYISTDKGVTWNKSFDGFNASNITDLAFDKKGNIYSSSYGGIHKSTNYGSSWISFGLCGRNLSCIALNRNGHLFTSESSYGYGIARSVDDGTTWTISTEGLFCGGIGSECPINDMYINKKGYIVAIGGSEYISKDNGDSWITFPISIGEQCFGMNNQGDLFTAGTNPLISRSIDDGETWSSVLVPTRLDFSCLEGIKSINFTKRKPYGFSYCGYNSSNNGLSWSKNGIPGFGMRVFFVDSLDNYFSWATSYSDFSTVLLYRSTNQGQSWDSLNSGVFHTNYTNPITKFFVSPNGYIFIAVENGGLYRSRDKFVSVEEKPKPSDEHVITPNPAFEFIEVSYLPLDERGSGGVDIKILNIYGQTVLSVGAIHELPLRIDVSGLAPSMYFIRIGDKTIKFVKL